MEPNKTHIVNQARKEVFCLCLWPDHLSTVEWIFEKLNFALQMLGSTSIWARQRDYLKACQSR